MKTRQGIGVALVGLLISTVAFAAGPVASEVTEEVAVAASSPSDSVMDVIIVTARRPDAAPKVEEFALEKPLDLLSAAPIHAPQLEDPVVPMPEIRISL